MVKEKFPWGDVGNIRGRHQAPIAVNTGEGSAANYSSALTGR